jgi:hypothetical protein
MRLGDVRPALEQALKACPASAELYGDAADLCAAAYRFEPGAGWETEALSLLRRGSDLGLTLRGRSNSPLYRELKKLPPFADLFRTPVKPVAQPATLRLTDPLGDAKST